ncbi:MAG: glycosyltransferase family 2 protein [Geminicoccaceae bacterium]
MLPHFFNHYSSIVDRFFVYDNGSTDGSLAMLAGDERVRVTPFRTEHQSFAETELRLSEEIWKNSIGLAEWAIVIDVDEHAYHEDLRSYLRWCREQGVTAIQAIGYEMVSPSFPDTGRRLCETVTTGVRCPELDDKLCFFDPSAIIRTNFSHGRHTARPEGRVTWPRVPEVLLLHYKKLGLDYEISRSAELRTGLGSTDLENKWGYQYLYSPEHIRERFERAASEAKPVPLRSREPWLQELGRLETSIALLRSQNDRLAVAAADRGAAATILEDRLDSAESEAQRLCDDLTLQEARFRAIEARAARAEEARSDLASELRRIRRSGSWRITRPLRALRDRFGKRSVGSGAKSASPAAAPLPATKDQLERRMLSDPSDWDLRNRYFELLERLSRSNLGSFHARLPEIPTPLMVRASTSDIWNLRQIFLDGDRGDAPYLYGDYAFEMPPLERILDLGAYCGYVAVYLANRFPGAEIMCVEPPGANFDALVVNTSPYPNIRCLAAAVWPERTALAWSAPDLGDWGNRFAPGEPGRTDTIPAYTISDILEMRGWDGADFIKCISLEAQVDLLTHPERPWADRALLVATKPPRGTWPDPTDEGRLLAAFPDELFERVTNASMILAFRRRSPPVSARPLARRAVPLVPASPRLRPIELAHVADRFGFYKFGRAGLNLVPSPPGLPPASVTCRLALGDRRMFVAEVSSGHSALPAAEVEVGLSLRDRKSGEVLVDQRLALGPATRRAWEVEIGPLSGSYDVTLSARTTAPATGDGQIPWIHIVDAGFH